MIVYNLLPDGGFVCGDTETKRTSYAYCSSPHADAAKRNPAKVALEMMAKENACTCASSPLTASYNLRNWTELEDSRKAASR
jgi:hypothetical protein